MGAKAKKNLENTENLKNWLLSFEMLIKSPVVVSLLIEKQRVVFYSALSKERWLNLNDDVSKEDTDEAPEIDLKKSFEVELQQEKELNRRPPKYIG